MKTQFTIRDLFWLVLVCALAVGWWLDHREQNSQIETLRPEVFPPLAPRGGNPMLEPLSRIITWEKVEATP
jgi:hypothetical protein